MFKSEPICILTAGDTVDGREVKQFHIDDMAETYDPAVYLARINVLHNGRSLKVGSVLSLEARGEKLFAVLKPNKYLLELIQDDQLLQPSCEIQPNFAKKGKSYLTGLAVVDEPASLGTTVMSLSSDSKDAFWASSGEVITAEKPSFFKKLLTKKDDEMKDELLLEALANIQETNAANVTALTALAEGVTKLATKKEPEVDSTKNKETETNGEGDLDEKFAAFKTELTNSFSSQLEDLKVSLSKVTDEPDRNEATGGDLDDEEAVL